MSLDLVSSRTPFGVDRISRRQDRRGEADVAATSARASAAFGAAQRPIAEVDRISKLIASAKAVAVAASVETAEVEDRSSVEELLSDIRRPRAETAPETVAADEVENRSTPFFASAQASPGSLAFSSSRPSTADADLVGALVDKRA